MQRLVFRIIGDPSQRLYAAWESAMDYETDTAYATESHNIPVLSRNTSWEILIEAADAGILDTLDQEIIDFVNQSDHSGQGDGNKCLKMGDFRFSMGFNKSTQVVTWLRWAWAWWMSTIVEGEYYGDHEYPDFEGGFKFLLPEGYQYGALISEG